MSEIIKYRGININEVVSSLAGRKHETTAEKFRVIIDSIELDPDVSEAYNDWMGFYREVHEDPDDSVKEMCEFDYRVSIVSCISRALGVPEYEYGDSDEIPYYYICYDISVEYNEEDLIKDVINTIKSAAHDKHNTNVERFVKSLEVLKAAGFVKEQLLSLEGVSRDEATIDWEDDLKSQVAKYAYQAELEHLQVNY